MKRPNTNDTMPHFRSDLIITPQLRQGGGLVYFIQDSLTGKMVTLGEEEYFLCQQLDGRKTISEVGKIFQENYAVLVSDEHLLSFVEQLKSKGLIKFVPIDKKNDGIDTKDTSLYSIKIFSPDRFFYVLSGLLSFCFSKFFSVVCLSGFLVAAGILCKYSGDIFQEVSLFIKTGFPVALPLLGVMAANIIGEIGKGVACRHFQGQVFSFHLGFIYRIIPRFYIDIADTLSSKDKRTVLKIIAAGPIAQGLFLAISIFCWENTQPWSFIHSFWLLNICATSIFLFFNVNPLLNRDGYQMLSAWWNMDNLRHRAITFSLASMTGKVPPEPLSDNDARKLMRFGPLAMIFDFVFSAFLIGSVGYLLVTTLKGLGACLFLVFLVLRFENVLKELVKGPGRKWNMGETVMGESGAVGMRLLLRLGLLVVFVYVMFIPYQYSVSGEFSLHPLSQYGIRAQVEGDIVEVYVQEGQFVKKGDPIAKLSGRDQERRYGETQAAMEAVKAQLDLLLGGPKREAIAKAEQEVKAAKTSVAHSEKRLMRQEELFAKKAVSEKDYDEAVKEHAMDIEKHKVAEKNLELVRSGAQDDEIRALEAQLRLLKVDVDYSKRDLELTTLHSPADGKIITAYPDLAVGQFLAKGDLFAVVEDSSRLIAEIKLSEKYVSNVQLEAPVQLKMWADPTKKYTSKVLSISPVAYEHSRGRVMRSLTEREWLSENEQTFQRKGQVVRVLAELPNAEDNIKTDMTGYAKITCGTEPVYDVFFRWLVRFVRVEMWSWIP